MPLYRALAELRRVHSDADWLLAGVLVDGRFFAGRLDIEPASARLIESGLVRRVALMPLIAPDLRRALSIARALARGLAPDAASATGPMRPRGGGSLRIEADLSTL